MLSSWWLTKITGSVGFFAITCRAHAMPASDTRHDSDSTMNFWPCASNTWYSWKPLVSRAPKVACFFARSVPNHCR
ncbi:hypothetical protein D3C85_257660 [compost metagenome]